MFTRPVVAALATLVVLLPGSDVPAKATQAGVRDSDVEVNSYGCDGAEALITIPTEQAKRWVPPEFHDDLMGPAEIAITGFPDVGTEMFLRTYRCERQLVGDRETRDTTTVIFGPLVSRREPDSGGAVKFFTNFYYSDNRDLIRWFRAGTGSAIFQYVPDLRYDFQALSAPTVPGAPIIGGDVPRKAGPFHIGTESPGRAFSFDGVASTVVTQRFDIKADWWFETASGRFAWFRNCIPAFQLSGAAATITPAPGSELEKILGPFFATGKPVSAWFAEQRTTWRLDDTPPDADADEEHKCPRAG